jgi:uncharacterized RDD family membrane protein YckC
MRVRVVTSEGVHPGVLRSLWRVIWLGVAIMLLFTGFLPVLIDSRRRALQDYLARTVVVYDGYEALAVVDEATVPVVRAVQPSA